MNHSKLKSVFGSEPLFELGSHVMSSYSFEESDGSVVHCREYGMVSGVAFCEDDNDYEGWTYDIRVYKTITINNKVKTVDLYPRLSYLQECEDNLEKCDKELDKNKIVKAMLLNKAETVESFRDKVKEAYLHQEKTKKCKVADKP